MAGPMTHNDMQVYNYTFGNPASGDNPDQCKITDMVTFSTANPRTPDIAADAAAHLFHSMARRGEIDNVWPKNFYIYSNTGRLLGSFLVDIEMIFKSYRHPD